MITNVITKRVIFLLLSILFSGSAFANPAGGVVASGNVQITQSANQTQVQQSSQKAIINWQSFNIGANEKTHFQQPKGGIALNRISATQGPSQIYGQLTATGKIILVNQAGIFFGPGSYVNVGGLIASTSGISDENFLAGKLIFDQPSSFNGSVINKGTIIAAQNGLIALLGNSVTNEGLIQVQTGNVVLASGKKFTVDLYGDQLINFAVDDEITSPGKDENGNNVDTAVKNSGKIIADGGTILMTAKAASGVVDNVINMSGIAQARSVDQKEGVIILSSDAPQPVLVSGLLDASGVAAGQKGGKVKILGAEIHLASTAKIDVSGDQGGGEILVGGNYQGKGTEQNALNTRVDAGAILNADAINNGDGGRVIVWSDNNTFFNGSISATGGLNGGNGGFAETSGHYLDVSLASVNLLASNGKTGTWLLDPTDLTISTSSNSNVSQSGSTFTGDANSATSILNVNTLTTALATANVIVQTQAGGSGSGNGDIIVANDIVWNTSTSLTLSAYRHITLNANITNATGSNISVNLQSDNTGTGTGTVTGAGVVTTTATGNVNIYYNPTNYTAPTDYSTNVSGGGTLRAFMLINDLGTDADSLTTKTLGALSNPLNTSLWNNKSYALGRDIDATSTASWNSGAGFKPIGSSSVLFTGSFDGQNHTIDKLFMNVTSNIGSSIGFFGDTNGSANVIRNIGLTNANITSQATQGGGQINTGILVGALYAGTISNAYTTGSITNTTGSVRIGGLTGYNAGSIQQSYSLANVSVSYSGSGSFANIGGLIGYNFGGSTSESYTRSASVTLTLTGGFSFDSIQVGGFIGANSGAITDSYSMNNVILQTNGSASSSLTLGGFTGWNIWPGSIVRAYSAGAVIASSGIPYGFGKNDNTMSNNFWDTGTSGNSTGATGVTAGCFSGGTCSNSGTANLSMQSTYTTWDFSSMWGIIEGQSYPYLRFFNSTTPRAISGAASASIPTNTNVVLSSGGTSLDATKTFANGAYYFLESNNTIADSTPLLIYLTGSATKANTVTLAPSSGGSLINATLSANTLQLGDGNNNVITNTILQQALGSLGTTDVLYSAAPTSLTLGAGSNLVANLTSSATTTYTIEGLNDLGTNSINLLGITDINASSITLNGSQTYSGNINLQQDIVFTAGNGGDITFDNASVLSGAYAVTLNANAITLSGTLSGLTGLSLIGNSIALNTTGITTTGAQLYDAPVTLGSNITLTGSQMTFTNNIIGNAHTLALQGDATNNDFIFNGTSSGTTSFTINGGSAGNDTINFSGLSSSIAVTLVSTGSNHGLNGITDYGNISFDNMDAVNGSTATNNSMTGANTASSWTTSGVDAGTYTIGAYSLSFNNFQQLISGGGNNTFIIPVGTSVTGIQGGAGINTIDYSSFSNDVSVNLTNSSATNIGSFSNIQVFKGGTGNNSIIDTTGSNTWTITGNNAGTIGSNTFDAFGNITGGNGDTFVLMNGASITGNLSGNNSTLDVSALSNPIINVGTNTSSGMGGTFSGISQFIGTDTASGNHNSTLIGPSGTNTWMISGINSGSLGTSTFNNFGNIVGGGGTSNHFILSAGASLTNINGGNTTGINQITVASSININLTSLESGSIDLTSNNSRITTFNQIQMATASGATGSIRLPSAKYTLKYYNSSKTEGEIGDPFYFSNFTISNPPSSTPDNLMNVMVSAMPSSSNDDDSSSTNQSAEATVTNNEESTVTTAVEEEIALTDLETTQVTTYGCFAAN